MSGEIALRARLSDAIREYEYKEAALESELKAFEDAGERIKSAVTIMGQWGRESLDTGRVYPHIMKNALTTSAWLALYEKLNLKTLMSANDKKRFEQGLSQAAEFNLSNIKATFGEYIMDPRGNILRGLAEVFCDLDQSYKSHDKVRIGVQGLPKRIILSGFNSYCGMGIEKIRDVLNALASYQGKPAVEWLELRAIEKNEDALRHAWTHTSDDGVTTQFPARGVWLRRFNNGNGHLFFDNETLKDINRALAEYYGDVLPDCSDEKPEARSESTAVSKDLQYYPTPVEVVDRVIADFYIDKYATVLEPSCGCGRILDGVKKAYPTARLWGIEVDAGRAALAPRRIPRGRHHRGLGHRLRRRTAQRVDPAHPATRRQRGPGRERARDRFGGSLRLLVGRVDLGHAERRRIKRSGALSMIEIYKARVFCCGLGASYGSCLCSVRS